MIKNFINVYKENKRLKEENEFLKTRFSVPEITVEDIDNPEPADQEQRNEYVARVAGFHEDVLKDKLNNLIAVQQQALSNPYNDRKIDWYIKGTINGFSLLLDWGESTVNEMISQRESNIDSVIDNNLVQ